MIGFDWVRHSARALLIGTLAFSSIEVRVARAAVPPEDSRPLPRQAADTASPGKAVKELASERPQPMGRVVQLPEEVVHGTGVTFGNSGAMTISMPSSEAQRLPGGFADPTRFLTSLPGISNVTPVP